MARTVHIKSAPAKRLFRELKEWGALRARMVIKGSYPDGTPIAEVAAIQEFGTSHIPSRPFLRMSRERQDEVAEVSRREYDSIVNGNRRARTAARRVAQKMAGVVVETIDRSKQWAAPNAPATVAKKGHDHPLVDTGVMRDKGVHWQTRKGDRVLEEGGARK